MTAQLTEEEILTIQEAIFWGVKQNEAALEAIKASSHPLIFKWQTLLDTLLPIQYSAIKSHGFSKDQKGLLVFKKLFTDAAVANECLQKKDDEIWLYIFNKAFGLDTICKLSNNAVRALIGQIAQEMIAESFLLEVDKIMATLDPKIGIIGRRKELLKFILPLHMSVMVQHGFEGEEGYLQAQRAIMDWGCDTAVVQVTNYAQQVLFSRAKVLS